MDEPQWPNSVFHLHQLNGGKRPAGRKRTILTLVDFDEPSLVALRTAVRTANEAGSKLFAVHLSDGDLPPQQPFERSWAGRVAESIAQVLLEFSGYPLRAEVTIAVHKGSHDDLVSRLRRLVEPDVIMAGWPVSGWNPDGVLASLCQRLACPLLLVPSLTDRPSTVHEIQTHGPLQ
jgi:hypothetical protein